MTRTLYLHVGSPKSGTTYLQRILDSNRDRLAQAGVLVVGDQHVDRVQAALQVREDPRWKKLPAARQDMWGTLVAAIKGWQGDSAVLSYELFSAASAEQAKRALADLGEIDVHVVITARDLARSVPSAWQERLKFGQTAELEEWTPTANRKEWGWLTTDPSAVAKRWGATLPADHVHVVTVPRVRSGDTELWDRFAAACGLTGVPVDLAVPRVNESLGAVEAELLRRVNGHLRAPLTNDREKSRWLRDTLANGILAAQGNEPLGMTDAQYADAAGRADRAIDAIAGAGYAVHGDPEDLRATRPEGRLPSEVSEAEVLDAALGTIVDLLLLVREQGHVLDGARRRRRTDRSAKGVVRNLVQGATAPYVRRRDEQLHDRLQALETEVVKDRELHQRVAALSDVVTELLLPVDLRDGEVTAKALRRYRRGSQ
ncbi:DUF6752 domain-containing protein [Nocardioides ultimimeridianus]